MGLPALSIVEEAAAEEAAAQTVQLTLIEGGAVAVEAGGAVAAGEAAAGGAAVAGIGGAAIATAGVALVVLGLLALGYYLYTRSQRSSDVPQSPNAVQRCETPRDEVPCFERPPGADKDEFERQLKEQQDELNKLSPDEYLQRRESYSPSNRDRSAQSEARRAYENERTEEYIEENLENGMTPEDAETTAKARIKSEMSRLDATHALDMVAGGVPSDISGLGDLSANRSIGSQWRDRVRKLDEIAEKAKKDGKDKLDVELKPCD